MPYNADKFNAFSSAFDEIREAVQADFQLGFIIDRVLPVLLGSPSLAPRLRNLSREHLMEAQSGWIRRSETGFSVVMVHAARRSPPALDFRTAYSTPLSGQEWKISVGTDQLANSALAIFAHGEEELLDLGMEGVLQMRDEYADELDTDYIEGIRRYKQRGIDVNSEDTSPAILFHQMQLVGLLVGIHDWNIRAQLARSRRT